MTRRQQITELLQENMQRLQVRFQWKSENQESVKMPKKNNINLNNAVSNFIL